MAGAENESNNINISLHEARGRRIYLGVHFCVSLALAFAAVIFAMDEMVPAKAAARAPL